MKCTCLKRLFSKIPANNVAVSPPISNYKPQSPKYQGPIRSLEQVDELGNMEKYEQLSVVGEGSYGVVMKCRHRDTDTIVAIKKFLETEEDATVRRMALREIRMLKRLRHENLVTMIEVFRHRKRFYLVFEYMEGTVLDELEKYPEGLGDELVRERIYQVTRAVQYCHSHHIIHRDVKPENILISSLGVVKLCDFGFARLVSGSGHDAYTEYVATRWYRAPELLVGENHYGLPVDVWAIGCLFSEMMTGEPLFPGDSDIDQLYLIIKLIGKPCSRHQQLMSKNTHLRTIKRASAMENTNLYKLFPTWNFLSIDFLSSCMKMDPTYRPSAEELLKHNYFLHDRFPEKFLPVLRDKVRAEFNENPLLRKFKVDILMSSEERYKREEVKPRKITQVEPPRWKINFVQDGLKRKFSSTGTDENSIDNRSIISLSKVSQKLSSVNKLGQFSKSTLQSLKREDKPTTEPTLNKYSSHHYIVPKLCQDPCAKIQKENPRLEKALDLLSKLNQKNQHRPKSTNKEQYNSTCLSPSPPEFQSLQSQSFREPLKTSSDHVVLHPNITNIAFNKDPKKSPYLIQNVNNVSLKTVFNQVPLANPPKMHHLKRLDRNCVVDTTYLNTEKNARFKSPPDWLSSVGMAQMKRDWKGKQEGFTLPIVPGATGSPNKSKKKTTPELEKQTPRILSSNSQKSTPSQIKHLPFM